MILRYTEQGRHASPACVIKIIVVSNLIVNQIHSSVETAFQRYSSAQYFVTDVQISLLIFENVFDIYNYLADRKKFTFANKRKLENDFPQSQPHLPTASCGVASASKRPSLSSSSEQPSTSTTSDASNDSSPLEQGCPRGILDCELCEGLNEIFYKNQYF